MKLILTLFCLLAACASVEKYDQALSLLIATSESKLIADWGSPQESRRLVNGDTVLTYNQVREIETGGLTTNPVNNYNTGRISSDFRSPTFSPSRSFAMPTTPTRIVILTCITHFTIRNGLIQSVSHEGDDCVKSD